MLAKFLIKRWFILANIFIFAAAIGLQHFFIANADSTWLMLCAKSWLQGKHYYTDFFETNPPLILFLLMPALWLQKIIPVREFISLEIMVFGLIIASSMSCYQLLKRILFSKTENGVADYSRLLNFTVLIIVSTLTILPYIAFTEREHLTVIFTLPYFLLVALRLQNKTIAPLAAITIGIAAGIGFSLKPYFLLPLVMVELYVLWRKRNLTASLRLETISIFLFMVGYLGLAILFFPDYFAKIYPLLGVLYTPVFQRFPVTVMVIQASSLSVVIALTVILWRLRSIRNAPYYDLVSVMFIAGIGFLLAFLWPGKIWYYHLYPAYSLVFITLSMLCFQLFDKVRHLNTESFREKLRIIIRAFIPVIALLNLFETAFVLNLSAFDQMHNPFARTTQLISLLNKDSKQQNVLIISQYFNEAARYYTGVPMTSRFPSMLLVPGITHLQILGREKQYQTMRQLFFTLLHEDIAARPPSFIYVDKGGYWIYMNGKIRFFSFWPFLLSDPKFAQLFKNYRWVRSSHYYNVYQKIV